MSPRARPSLCLAVALALLASPWSALAQTPAIQAVVANAPPEQIAAQPSTRAAAPDAPAARPVAEAPRAASEPGMRMFRGRPEDDLLHEMATRPVRRVIERFNSSTLVFHCDLGDGYEIAFKPARRGERDWWVHEVAGYELARALGIEGRVPPAVMRRVPIGALDGFLREANLEVGRDGTVAGAAIVWMPVLRRTNLHTPEARAQWNAWLDPREEIAPADRTRAQQIASLIVYDYLQANFDRWNAANVPQDEHNDLVFRDNNRAWYIQNLRATGRGGIEGIRRLPASLLSAVERTTGEVLAQRTETASPQVLNHSQVREYEVRRRALLARVEEAVREYGRERVLMDDRAAPVARIATDAGAATADEGHHHRRRHGRDEVAATPPVVAPAVVAPAAVAPAVVAPAVVAPAVVASAPVEAPRVRHHSRHRTPEEREAHIARHRNDRVATPSRHHRHHE